MHILNNKNLKNVVGGLFIEIDPAIGGGGSAIFLLDVDFTISDADGCVTITGVAGRHSFSPRFCSNGALSISTAEDYAAVLAVMGM